MTPNQFSRSSFQVAGCIVAMLSIAQFAFCEDEQARQSDDRAAHVRERPVVRWTANCDEMNFRYDFLRKVETTTLHRGTRLRGEYAPAPAADAGLNRLEFSEEFNDYRGIDVNDSKRAGFNFYPDRPFSWPSTKRSDYSVQNGYLRIAADTNYSQQELTSAAITGNCRWEGYTYDPAEPFYFETRVRWDPSRGVVKSKKAPGAGFPAAWSNPQQLRAGCGLNQHVEIDFVEWNNNWYSDGARHYTQALHLWTKGNDEQLVRG